MGEERMKTGRTKRIINQRMITCETQIHRKQISLMLCHVFPVVLLSSLALALAAADSYPFAETTNPSTGLSVSPRCKVEFRNERRPWVPMPE